MVPNNATEYACEIGVVPANPLKRVKWAKPRTAKAVDPRVAIKRRNNVLSKMASLHMISRQQAATAKAQPLGVVQNTYYSAKRENYFFDYVKEQLIERYGVTTVRKGGLKVYTTIDLNMQRLARKAIAEILNQPEDPASAIVTDATLSQTCAK